MPSLAQQQADLLTRAREDGDANAAAQVLLAAEDRGHVKTMSDMSLGFRNDERAGFWSDVETLLRLETASDEPANPEPPTEPTWDTYVLTVNEAGEATVVVGVYSSLERAASGMGAWFRGNIGDDPQLALVPETEGTWIAFLDDVVFGCKGFDMDEAAAGVFGEE